MKKKLFIITLFMILFAVQGYAQRERHGSRREHRSEYRGNQQQAVPARSTHRGYQSQPPQKSRDYRYESKRYPPRHTPPRHRYPTSNHYRPAPPPPQYNHHYRYYHHPYQCHFRNWYWYTWGGYHNRFICHQNYRDRYFDSMLGYYLWGSLNAPTRLDIGDMSLTRYNNMLKIQIGTKCSYLDLYQNQNVIYKSGNTTISVSTGNGYASIRFYDEYGNEAIYSL